MLISEKTQKAVEAILDKYLDAMIVFTTGKSSVSPSRLKELFKLKIFQKDVAAHPLSDQAYWIGRLQREGLSSKEAESALMHLKETMASQLSISERAGLKLAGRVMNRELVKHKERIKNVVGDMILSGNYIFRNAQATPEAVLSEGLLKRKSVQQMARDLRDKTGDFSRDFLRVSTTELTNTMNAGALDQILSNNKGKPTDSIYVFKSIKLDEKTCNYCKKFYLEPDLITPKVYPLSELIANGSNYGKKQADWKPCVPATHPYCRGLLLEMPNGWAFKPGTASLTYIDPNFLWARDKNNIPKQA